MSKVTKFLAATALLLLPIISACGDEVPPPPPTGSIDGLVSIEGQGVDAVSVTLSNGASATTANGGMYRFDGVEVGAYTVTISNYPADASFDQTSAAATIATDGETVTINFPGTFIRTSSIMGTVTVENEGLVGVTVKLSGTGESETLTDANGQYAFTGLRAGNYTVEISGFDDEDVSFGSSSSSATVAMGESKVVSFEGTYLRTSGILGQITAGNQPQEGVTVSLQGRGENRSMTTNSAGQYAFDELRSGDYAIGISGYNTDEMSFDVTSQTVTVAHGETANIPFEGTLLRTAGIMGTVSVEGVGPIEDVTVTIQGNGENESMATNSAGEYSFERLHAGDYSVTISGFDDDEYGFDVTTATVTVALQDTETVEFDGIMLRTAGISGEVTVGDDDAPLSGVTVTVSGGPRDEEHSRTTDSDGAYLVENLHAGDYSVVISGYDTREYGFEPTTETVSVGLRETLEVAFQGELLRTSGVSGRVHVGGMGLAGVTVTMTGEESRELNTDADGQYGFAGLAAGDYTLTISGWDGLEYTFDPASKDFTLALDDTKTGMNFMGRSLRTATVMGSVTVEGAGLAGIAVTLIKVVSATSGEILGTKATAADGGYSFGPLLAGAYRVMIAGYSDEHDFAAGTTWTGAVATDQTMEVDFPATIIRTASVSGMVTLDGDPKEGIELTITGDHAPDDNTMTTGDDGMYEFDGLRKGDYTVTMTNPNKDAYSFPTTSRSMNLSVGQKQTGISFAGVALRRASISGQVHAEGDGVPGVTVTLSGKEDGLETTDANGEYNFSGLAGGTYVVEISGWNEDAYEFPSDSTRKVVELGDAEPAIEDFAGEHTKTASISGMLFLDEVNSDGKHTDGEPMLDLSAEIAALVKAEVIPAWVTGLPLMLRGPGLDDERSGMANADGTYTFPGLRAGKYRVGVAIDLEVNNDGLTVGDLLTGAGYRYSGDNEIPVSVEAAEEMKDVHFPFEITMQTIMVGAVMGNGSVPTEVAVKGVKLAMYPTVQDANAGTNMLDEATTDSAGMAMFDFLRAKDLGAGGHGTDHLVFVKVKGTGHNDLAVSHNASIEIAYGAVKRRSDAPTAVRLLNRRVNFQWMVKSDAGARGGDEPLADWKVVMGTDTIVTDAKGMAEYNDTVAIADLPATVTVMLDTTQVDSLTTKGEDWKQSKALTYKHDGLALPLGKDDEVPNAGTIHVTWTTQTLVVGVYRERDDIAGYKPHTSHRDEDDQRPAAAVAKEMTVEVQRHNGRKWVEYEWDHDLNPKTDPMHPTLPIGADGLVKIRYLPATEELRLELDVGQYREVVTELDEVNTYGNDLDEGMTLGSFGAEGGGVPEVRLCTASLETSYMDDDCATFGYQWMTGSVDGTVAPATKDIEIDLVAVTDNHGAGDDDDATNTSGKVAFPGIQDGTYDLTATGNDDWQISATPTQRVWCYHDEDADETNESKADSAWAGTACSESRTWSLTQKGLEVRGYVANVDHEYNKVVRGDETYEGAELEIKKYLKKAGTDAAIPLGTGLVLGTATVQADGSYRFEGLDAGKYIITAKNTALYEALQSHPTDNVAGPATAMAYVAVSEQNETLALPFWTYETSRGEELVDAVTVGTGANAVNMTFHNFALLHADGAFSGAVREASGRAGDIAVELRRCLVYTEADPDASPPVEETCSDDRDFRPQVKQTSSGGAWSFPSLREGYYQVNLAATGYWRAKWSVAKGIDDDADNCKGTTEPVDNCDAVRTDRKFDLLKGKTAFNRDRATYYVYNGNLRTDDVASAITVTGVTTVGGDAAAITGLASPATTNDGSSEALGSTDTPITFGDGGNILVKATLGAMSGASYEVMRGTEPKVKTYTPNALTGASVPLEFTPTPATGGPDTPDGNVVDNTITVLVTAENGYQDHSYTFTATRTNPAGNELAIGDVTATTGTTGGSGTDPQPYTVVTASADANSVVVTFNLAMLGEGTEAKCVQSVAVYAPGATSAMTAATDTDPDACRGEQYSLTAETVEGTTGTTYRVVMYSEDYKSRNYYVNVSLGT